MIGVVVIAVGVAVVSALQRLSSPVRLERRPPPALVLEPPHEDERDRAPREPDPDLGPDEPDTEDSDAPAATSRPAAIPCVSGISRPICASQLGSASSGMFTPQSSHIR